MASIDLYQNAVHVTSSVKLISEQLISLFFRAIFSSPPRVHVEHISTPPGCGSSSPHEQDAARSFWAARGSAESDKASSSGAHSRASLHKLSTVSVKTARLLLKRLFNQFSHFSSSVRAQSVLRWGGAPQLLIFPHHQLDAGFSGLGRPPPLLAPNPVSAGTLTNFLLKGTVVMALCC